MTRVRQYVLLLAAAFCISAHAEEAEQPAWSAPPEAYATVSNIVAVREPFNRALVLDQAFVEVTPEKSLRFWFRFHGPNYRIYSEAGEARRVRRGAFLYSGNGDSTCDLLFRLQPKHFLRIEGQPTVDGSQGGHGSAQVLSLYPTSLDDSDTKVCSVCISDPLPMATGMLDAKDPNQ